MTFNGNTIIANYNTFMNTLKSSDPYKAIPFDSIDPDVYKTRSDRFPLFAALSDRSASKQRYAERWVGFTRAYWCLTCSHCQKEVRFCSMCQGELFPVDKKSGSDDSVKKLQCTECHRVITMRFCSNCGHQFRDEKVDARMEIPGVNVGLRCGGEA